MLSQKILQGLFRALDLAEEVRAAVNRMRGKPVEPPPWEAPPPPTWNPPPPPPSTKAPVEEAAPSPAAKKRAPKKPATKAKAPAKPRAEKPTAGEDLAALFAALKEGSLPSLSEDLEVDGRNLLARMVWALAVSEKTLERGLTGPDVAALITRAGIKTVPNNIMRAVRQDDGRLFERTPGTGRAVILRLTQEGREKAQALGLL